MKLTPLTPLGVEVADVDLQRPDTEVIDALRDALAEHGVVVLRDQELDDAGFLAFLQAFGPLAFTAGEAHAPGFPDLNVVTNVGRTTPPRSQWHVDTSYVDQPPAYTALRAVEVPEQGGETLFCDQRLALGTLDPALRADVEGRTVLHRVTGVDPGAGEQTEAEHPLVRPHPRTGRPSLYLSTPQRCAVVSGLDEERGAALIAELLEHSTREERVLRHQWRPGDVVLWDNACVLHRADHSGVVGDRTMHRGMVAGYDA